MTTNSNKERERLLNQCSMQASELLNTFNKIHSIKIQGRLVFHMPVDNKLKDISCNTQRALKDFKNRQLKVLYNDLATANSTLTKTIQTLPDFDRIINQADKDIFKIGANIMDMETKEASIAEEIHNVISAIKTFIKRIVDFLVSKVSNIGGKNPGLSETNSHSFFPSNGSEDDTATPSHRSPTLNTA